MEQVKLDGRQLAVFASLLLQEASHVFPAEEKEVALVFDQAEGEGAIQPVIHGLQSWLERVLGDESKKSIMQSTETRCLFHLFSCLVHFDELLEEKAFKLSDGSRQLGHSISAVVIK